MADWEQRLRDAREQVRQLKQEIDDATSATKLVQISAGKKPPPAIPQLRKKLAGHTKKVFALQWGGGAYAKKLVSASGDQNLLVWNASKCIRTHVIKLKFAWMMTCAYEPTEGRLIATGGLDNTCSVFNLSMTHKGEINKPQFELQAHDGYLACCRFLDNRRILTCSGDSSCILWDLEKPDRPDRKFSEHSADVMSVAVASTNNNIFASGSCDGTARIWDIRSRNACQRVFMGHDSDINSVEFLGNGYSLGTGSDDSSARLFDLRAVHEIAIYQNPKVLCGITSIAFSKSGRLLFVGYDDYNCLMWDVLSETEPLGELGGHAERISCLGVSQDGTALCTGSWDTTLLVWA